MILANFDLSFFTSIPGLLITGGVLLLLIALIIFIATGSKKGKKEKKEEKKSEEAVNTTPTVDNNATVAVADVPQSVVQPETAQNIEPTPAVVTTEPVVNSTPIVENNTGVSSMNSVPPVQNVEPKVEAQVPNNAVNPAVTETPAPVVNATNEEVAPTTPVVDMPKPSQEVVPTITPTPIETPTPTVSVPNNTVTPNAEVAASEPITIVNEEPTREEPKPIYGGASPVIPKIDVGEEHRPIYGGADPLENTGAIPTINNQASINNAESTPVVPTIPTVNEQPKVETVEPITVTTPQVETPTVETPKVEVPTQETVTPTVTETIPKVDTTPAAPKQDDEIESLF